MDPVFVEFPTGNRTIRLRGKDVSALEEQTAAKTIVHMSGSTVTVDAPIDEVVIALEKSWRAEQPVMKR